MRISDWSSDVCSSDLRILPGLYCVGWARRGPTGTIGTNRPDGYMIAEKIGEDIGKGDNKAGRPGLDALLAERQVEIVTFLAWQQIAAADVKHARNCSPRETFVAVAYTRNARRAGTE